MVLVKKKIYWHLPGLYQFFYLNQMIIKLMKEYPDKFHDGYEIGSVYGTFPGAIWNGGRLVYGVTTRFNMEKIIRTYNDFGVPVRFTWTNSLLEEKHLHDTYCNLIMELADNGMNQVLVNREVLESYLRSAYPGFRFISSTTKRITNLDELRKEVEKNYALIVLDYDFNYDRNILDAIKDHASKIELIVDDTCVPNCPKRKQHYDFLSLQQLRFEKEATFKCPMKKALSPFTEIMKREQFIPRDKLYTYIGQGFVNYKLVGRGIRQDVVEDSYIYYLVKEEHAEFIRKKLDIVLRKLPQKLPPGCENT